jgi:hypothetical protein
MRALYHIDQELQAINEELMAAQGELTPELENKLVITKAELAEKSVNYAMVILNNQADTQAIETEIKRLKALKDAIDSTTDKLKEAVSNAMLMHDLTEVKSPLVKMSFRKSKSVHITDENELDASFFEYKRTVNKTAIKKAIEGGELVAGAELIEKNNLQIK